jgi:hypothetical protein
VLNAPSPVEVRVTATTEDVEAIAGGDYTATAQEVVFPPQVTVQTLSVPLIGDTQAEPDETFRLVLTNPVNATLADAAGVCTIADNDGAISVPGPPVPAASFLGRGAPNPFAAELVLEWGLSVSGFVELTIYDAAGRRVRRLEHGTFGPGYRTTVWNGRDEGGSAVGTGFYFARLQVGPQTFLTRIARVR